jgi:hypothetical protein
MVNNTNHEAAHYVIFSSLPLLTLYVLLCTLFSDTLSLYSPLKMRDQVSHPYKATGTIIVLFNEVLSDYQPGQVVNSPGEPHYTQSPAKQYNLEFCLFYSFRENTAKQNIMNLIDLNKPFTHFKIILSRIRSCGSSGSIVTGWRGAIPGKSRDFFSSSPRTDRFWRLPSLLCIELKG